MESVRPLRIAVASALFCAAMTHAECVSLLRETSSGVFNRTAAGVSWSGTLLGVAKVDGSSSKGIVFATYSDDLVQFTSDRQIAAASFAGVTALLWSGSEFAVFYEDFSGQLLLQRISAQGEPIAGAIAVAPNHVPSTQREYDAAWDPRRQAYLIAHSVASGDKGLWLTILNRDGTVRSEDIVSALVSPPLAPRVAVNDNGVVAVLFRRNGVYSFRLFDASGVGGVIEPLMTARDARIASDGASFAIAGNAPANAPTEIDWAIVDDHGAIIVPARKLFARGAEIAPVSLYWNASRGEWALAYLSSLFPFAQVPGDYRLRRFTASGSLISDATFAPDPILTKLSTSLPFAWTGSSYASAASRSASGSLQPESYVVRHCPITASIGTPAQYVRAGQSVTFTAKVDGGAGDNSYSWDFGDGRTSTAPAATVRYDKLGDYTITLRVTDSTGASSVTSMVLHIVTPRRRGVTH